MSSIEIDEISSGSSMETFAPVAVYRLKYYKPESLFDNVLYALIRPPRFVYNQKLLVPGRRYRQRFDYEVHNIPFPLSIYWAQNPQYIILYLHGNSSSRFEGYLHLKQLPEGACLACFDFKGCGLRRDGKFITLGKQQSVEVDIAVEYLKSYGYPIVGWGRSMGAVSLLMSSKCQIMIADSPFASLYNLCKQTSLNFVPAALCCLVHCLFPCIFCCVRTGVQSKSGMDPKELQIIKAVENQSQTKCLLIMAGKQDSMIHHSHASKLHQAFKGKNKRLILFEGTHNSTRPSEVLDECFEFIDACFELKQCTKSKIQNPTDHPSQFKVLKVDRQSSKQSLLVNHQTVPLVDQGDLQNSKETLLMNLKVPVQLRPLKVSPSKSSPKKLSKIQGDFQHTEEANIQINQEQDIIREGIGRFQQNITSKGQQKITFKLISKKNQIQNMEAGSIKLKSIKPIQQISFKQQMPPRKNLYEQSNIKEKLEEKRLPVDVGRSLTSFINQGEDVRDQLAGQIKKGDRQKEIVGLQYIHKQQNLSVGRKGFEQESIKKDSDIKQKRTVSPQPLQKIDKSGQIPNPDQMQSSKHKNSIRMEREKLFPTEKIKSKTPQFQPSSLVYDDVRLLDEEIDSLPDRQQTRQLVGTPSKTPIQLFLNKQDKRDARLIKDSHDKNFTPRVQPNELPVEVDNNRVSVDNLRLKKVIQKTPQNCQEIYDAKVLQLHEEGINDEAEQKETRNYQKDQTQFIDL